MPDPQAAADLASAHLSSIITAVGALGAAAFGLVDASKTIAGGMSNPGFGYVREAVEPLTSAAAAGAAPAGGAATAGGLDRAQILRVLRANWLNGVAKADQKAIAKSLIRMGLTSVNATALAGATGLNTPALVAATTSIENGTPLTPTDLNVLGRFDAVVSAKLDYGYERGDQFYRNSAKLAAAVVAIVIAVVGTGIVYGLSASNFWLAVLIGAISTPLAPIAKDLSSTLAAAVKAVGGARR
jgi:hypothetical protein